MKPSQILSSKTEAPKETNEVAPKVETTPVVEAKPPKQPRVKKPLTETIKDPNEISERYKKSTDITQELKEKAMVQFGIKGNEDAPQVQELKANTLDKVGTRPATEDTIDVIHYTGKNN
jgi:hypothetical protein